MAPLQGTVRRTTLVLALSVLGAPAVNATSEDERKAELGIFAGAGVGDEKLVGIDYDTDAGRLVGGRLAMHFTDRVAGYFDVTWVHYAGQKNLYGHANEHTSRVGPEWYVNPASRWQFFVNLGLGAVRYGTDFGGDEVRGMGSLGLGVRRGSPPGAFRLDLRLDHTVIGADKLGGKDFTAIKAFLGWTWGIGARPKVSLGSPRRSG